MLTRATIARKKKEKKKAKKEEGKCTKGKPHATNMAKGETHIRGNWRPLARDHAQFRPNKTRGSHPVIHTHIRVAAAFSSTSGRERARARFCIFQPGVWNRVLVLSLSLPLSSSDSLARSFALSLSLSPPPFRRAMYTLATIEK